MAASEHKCKETHTVLALSKENCLLKITIPEGTSKIVAHHGYKSNPCCSFSPAVGNRIYLIGGFNHLNEHSLDCFYYDLTDHNLYPGPKLKFPKWQTSLIVLGSSLFAFTMFEAITKDSYPICEVLDTASTSLEWRSLNTYPVLPSRQHVEKIYIYLVMSYAACLSSDSLFISFGNLDCSITYCYDHNAGRWSNFSEKSLPFLGEGKFVGIICYAFPKTDRYTYDSSSYLAAYNLSIDWETDARVSCAELCRYPQTSVPARSISYLHPSGPNIFTIVRTEPGDSAGKYSSFLEVDLVQLSPPGRPARSGSVSVSVPSQLSALPLPLPPFPLRQPLFPTLDIFKGQPSIPRPLEYKGNLVPASVIASSPPIEKQSTLPASPPLESDIIEGSSHALKRKRPLARSVSVPSQLSALPLPPFPLCPLPPFPLRQPLLPTLDIFKGQPSIPRPLAPPPYPSPASLPLYIPPASYINEGSIRVLKHKSIGLAHALHVFLGEYN